MAQRVAIIGGGCASMTTAWELTQPHLDGQFEVTVYQQGWRLGGKGASGRGQHGRIEEHGLHLWLGHYDNAFALMKEVYAELARDPKTCPIATWRDAFEPANWVGLTDPTDRGEWLKFLAHFPPQPGEPGDPRSGDLPTFADFLRQTLSLIRSLIQGAAGIDPSEKELGAERVLELVKEIVSYGQIATLTALQHALLVLDLVLARTQIVPRSLYTQLISVIVDSTHRLLEPLLEDNVTARYTWEVIDIVLACFRGSAAHDLINDPRGFDAVDDYDIRDWLVMHGADKRSVESAFVRGLYDLAFAYDNGVPNGAKLAAGQGLRGGMRMFFYYREAIFWKMTAGMGDIVFAPIYEALIRRGVKFEFFHRLENVCIDTGNNGESPHVSTLEFDVQAETKGTYEPLFDVNGIPCWPSEPFWGQIKNGTKLQKKCVDFESFWDLTHAYKKKLSVREDFDFVVLGLSIGAIPHTCQEILKHNPRWREMVKHVRTVPTQALQLWMTKDLKALGWLHPSANVSGFVEPFGTWADMTHLIPVKGWNESAKSLAYFCNVLPAPDVSEYNRSDPDFPTQYRQLVLENSRSFLRKHIRHLWPNSLEGNGEFKWHWLHTEETTTKDPLATQFWTANINPTDRYVLCPPGSIQHRISPLDNTYDNLTITGDWTSCGLNLGCVESAVMSGRLAANALSLSPNLSEISGYDHV